MKISLTYEEAVVLVRERFGIHLPKDDIEIRPHRLSKPQLLEEYKVDLIKFARQVAADTFRGKIKPESNSEGVQMSLKDGRDYVEQYWSTN